MFWILISLVGFGIVICIAVFIIFYIEYKKYRTLERKYVKYYNPNALFDYDIRTINCKEIPLFSFNSFLNFYNLNPEQWIYYTKDEIMPYPTRKEVIIRKFGNCEDVRNEYYPIFFSTLNDYRKYKKWAEAEFKSMEENKNSKRRYENTEELIKLIQKDIDKKREEAKQDLSKAKELIEGCVNND